MANQRVPLTPNQPYTPNLETTLTSALLANHSIPRIQSAVTESLSQSGWTTNLRQHILYLFRSGECSTMQEALARVMEDSGVAKKKTVNGVNGHSNGTNGVGDGPRPVSEGGIMIPEAAARKAVEVTREELEKICDVKRNGQ